MASRTRRKQPNCAIGLDVGGTKMAAGLIDLNGKVLASRRVATLPRRGGEAVLHDGLELVQGLHRQGQSLGLTTTAIGVSVCELVGSDGGILSEAAIAWRGMPVAGRFSVIAPARVEADSRAAAFCEACCGAGRPFRTFFYVTVGTGIGSSWVVDGRPWTGAAGCAGTLASAPAVALCPSCNSLANAVLEEIASGPALVARYNARANAKLGSCEEVLAAAARGDHAAEWVIDTAVQSLGATLGSSSMCSTRKLSSWAAVSDRRPAVIGTGSCLRCASISGPMSIEDFRSCRRRMAAIAAGLERHCSPWEKGLEPKSVKAMNPTTTAPARTSITLALLGLLAWLLPSSRVAAENWPCFRGPTRQGASAETKLPLHWSAAENVAWKTPVPGAGWSSPIVWDDRVFVTTATGNGTSCRVLGWI